MPFQCMYQVAGKSLKISIPEERSMLPGRLLRSMIANIETKYKVFEYFLVQNEKELDAAEDVIEAVPLWPSLIDKATFRRPMVAFRTLDRSFYVPQLNRLSKEQLFYYKRELGPDEELVEEDYSLVMPPDLFILATDNLKKFTTVASHLKLRNFGEMQAMAAKLGDASIAIYDQADMYIEYDHDSFPALITFELEEWLLPPQMVSSLD